MTQSMPNFKTGNKLGTYLIKCAKPGLFLFILVLFQHNDKLSTKFDYKWCVWYSNPGPQGGRCRWIYWAMAALYWLGSDFSVSSWLSVCLAPVVLAISVNDLIIKLLILLMMEKGRKVKDLLLLLLELYLKKYEGVKLSTCFGWQQYGFKVFVKG